MLLAKQALNMMNCSPMEEHKIEEEEDNEGSNIDRRYDYQEFRIRKRQAFETKVTIFFFCSMIST